MGRVPEMVRVQWLGQGLGVRAGYGADRKRRPVENEHWLDVAPCAISHSDDVNEAVDGRSIELLERGGIRGPRVIKAHGVAVPLAHDEQAGRRAEHEDDDNERGPAAPARGVPPDEDET